MHKSLFVLPQIWIRHKISDLEPNSKVTTVGKEWREATAELSEGTGGLTWAEPATGYLFRNTYDMEWHTKYKKNNKYIGKKL